MRLRPLFFLVVLVWMLDDECWGARRCPSLDRVAQNVAAGITDSNRPFAVDWLRRRAEAPEIEARGMLKAVQEKELLGILETFRTLPPDANPLGSPENVYRVIGDFTNPNDYKQTVDGLDTTVRNLFSGAANPEKGVLLDLKVADDVGLASKATPGAGFQRKVGIQTEGGPVERTYDLLEPDPVSPLGGICHENKNWLTPLDGPNDGRLLGLVEEFQRDIPIHNGSNFGFLRLNFRQTVAGQSEMIFNRLLIEFDNPLVVSRLPLGRAAELRAAFQQRWSALVKFY